MATISVNSTTGPTVTIPVSVLHGILDQLAQLTRQQNEMLNQLTQNPALQFNPVNVAQSTATQSSRTHVVAPQTPVTEASQSYLVASHPPASPVPPLFHTPVFLTSATKNTTGISNAGSSVTPIGNGSGFASQADIGSGLVTPVLFASPTFAGNPVDPSLKDILRRARQSLVAHDVYQNVFVQRLISPMLTDQALDWFHREPPISSWRSFKTRLKGAFDNASNCELGDRMVGVV